jgi:5-formyltetrahydrofolate cyclo-ligase
MNRTDKRTLRKEIRAEIAKLSPEEKAQLSSQIFSKLDNLAEICDASVIALFIALPDEPETSTFIEQLLHKNKRVVVPRIEGDEMNFYDISEGLKKGSFGIMEPTSKKPIEPSKIDVMIVPGVAFTRDGARCGRGKGFYDKYLSHNEFRARTIGVCYPCQVVEDLPTETHDKRLEEVVFG